MSLPARMASRIYTVIGKLATNPRPPGCVKLSGPDALYRVRIGDYRLIYEIQDERLVVVIVRVGKRDEGSYRNL
jgi:mRNA interferase RelE/StbE